MEGATNGIGVPQLGEMAENKCLSQQDGSVQRALAARAAEGLCSSPKLTSHHSSIFHE